MPDDIDTVRLGPAPTPDLYPNPQIASAVLPARSVAVVLRTCDRPAVLPRALASVCAQTHQDWRLYLVNDGGDAALLAAQIAPHAEALAGRLVLIDRPVPPHGIYHAGQAALDRATEDLVVMHDDDDSWEPGFLQAVTDFLDDPAHAGYVAVSTGCTLIEEEIRDGAVHERWRCPWPHGRHLLDLRRALVDAQVPPICLAFRRAALGRIGGFQTRMRFVGDWEFLVRLLLVGEIGHIETPLANYHHRVAGTGAAYGNTVVDHAAARADQWTLLNNAMLRAGLGDRPEMLGVLRAVLQAVAEADPADRLDGLARDIAAIAEAQQEAAGTVTATHRDLAALDARLARIEETLADLRQVAHWNRKGLVPLLWAWRRALPMRRLVARARGRVPAEAAPPRAAPPRPDIAGALRAWRRNLVDVPVLGAHLMRREMVRRYTGYHGHPPRLDPPRGFNAHVIARILRDRDPRLKTICDKRAVREVVRGILGDEVLVPLLGAWEDPAQVPWESLPPPFVVKPNHASGLVLFVDRPEDVVPSTLSATAASWLAKDYFDGTYEWGYRGIPRCVLVEPRLRGADGGRPEEVQVFVFGGRASHVRIVTGGKYAAERTDNWFDPDGVRQQVRLRTPAGTYRLDPALARRLAEMGEALAAGYVHLRVDFYLTDQGVRFSELTPYSLAGSAFWEREELDLLFGRLWDEGEARLARR